MSILSLYKEKMKQRPDTEHQQALIRLIIVFLCLGYNLVLNFFQKVDAEVLLLFIPAAIISMGIFTHIFFSPQINVSRRLLGTLHDAVMTTLLLVFAKEKAALFLFVYPWVAIGNGFRYGVKYLLTSTLLSTVGLLWIVYVDDYWHQHYYFGLGILIMNIAVNSYTAFLLIQLQNAQSEIEKMATHDALTGLANRRLLMDRLKNSILINQRQELCVAVMYFDLDGFKAVNDQHGHEVGDLLLKNVSEKVSKCIRETDTFARLGGDEFVIVLDLLNPPIDPSIVGLRVLKAIEQIQMIEDKKVKVSASIGIAKIIDFKKHVQVDPEQLIKVADEAMYKAKKSGKGRIELAEL